MAKYEQYDEYKDSGVEWLSEMPNHWIETSLKYHLKSIIAGGTPESSNDSYWALSGEGVPWVSIADMSRDFEVYKTNKDVSVKGKVIKNLKVVPKETILYSIFASLGKVAIAKVPLVTNQAILGLEPSLSLYSGYLVYWLKYLEPYLSLYSTSNTQDNLNAEKVGNLPLLLTGLYEQTQIANFLDHETAQIDTLIDKQQTLIQLLKEKRQAVISHAVTKGLNPDAPMKDSGVEWLGEVPEHWDISKLKWRASTTSGGTPTTSRYEDYYEDGYIPWVRTTDLNNNTLNETPIMITPKAVRDSACSLLPKNSILLAMYGGAGSIGKHSLLNFESTINQAVCGILPSEAFIPNYLHRFYEFYRPFWMIGAAGTRKDPNIGQDNIKEAKVLIPPLDEQKQIADYLNKMQNHFDALTESAEQAIQLMQERRTALISAAVTGKIDVRGWRAPE